MVKKTTKTEHIKCPYCDEQIWELKLPFCTSCHVELLICPDCKKPVPRESKACPSCGSKFRAKKDK